MSVGGRAIEVGITPGYSIVNDGILVYARAGDRQFVLANSDVMLRQVQHALSLVSGPRRFRSRLRTRGSA